MPAGVPPGVFFNPAGVDEVGPDDGIGDAWKQVRVSTLLPRRTALRLRQRQFLLL